MAETRNSIDTRTAVDILIDNVQSLKESVDKLTDKVGSLELKFAAFEAKCQECAKKLESHETRLNDPDERISYGGLGKVATVVTGLLAAAAAALVSLFQAMKPPTK